MKRLLTNGDRWEREIAKNISLDAPIDEPAESVAIAAVKRGASRA